MLDSGEHMRVLPWEAAVARDHFSGTREIVVLIPKKNGKTTFIAALVLFHALITPDCNVIIVASSVKQATIMYRQIVGFIRRSGLRDKFLVRDGTKEIRCIFDVGVISVLASDADTADGAIPTLAIVDELHRQKQTELYAVLRDGLDGRDGQMVAPSTAGNEEKSPLGQIRERARSYADATHRGAHHRYVSDDRAFALHEWALELTEDRSDMKVVKRANPAPWHTVRTLRRRHDSPTTTPWDWARFACNVWYPWHESSAIRPEDWDACFDERAVLTRETPVYLGLDLGWKQRSDLTAIVPFAWISDELRILGDPVILRPVGDGSLLDDRTIATALLIYCAREEWHRRAFVADLARTWREDIVEDWAEAISHALPYEVKGIVFDPSSGAQQLAQQLEREHDLPFIRFDQKPSALVRADMAFLEAVRRRVLRHRWNTTARAHVMNAVEVAVPSGGMYFGRAKGGPRKPTDALRAASMVHSVVLAADGRPRRDLNRSRTSYAFL